MDAYTPSVSLTILARPGELECVSRQILNVSGTEIQSTNHEGQLRVTLAAKDREELHKRIDFLQFLEGMQSLSLSYH